MKSWDKLTCLLFIGLAARELCLGATAQGTAKGGPIPANPALTSGSSSYDAAMSGSGVVATGNAVTVKLVGLQHDAAGDLTITLSYIDAQGNVVRSVDVVNRVALTAADFGNDQGSGDNYYFNSDFGGDMWAVSACSDPPACTTPFGDVDSIPGESTDTVNHGQYFSSTAGGAKTNLSYAFTGLDVKAGTWRLTITDSADPNAGSFVGWEIFINTVPATPAAPQTITATGGTPQSTAVGSSFAAALQAVVKDGSGNGVSGVTVTFTAPGSGATATFNGSATITAVTNTAGTASSPIPLANSVAGAYNVAASVSGVTAVANFSLTNTAVTASASAVFQRTDASTAGNWKGVYGGDGSVIPNDSAHAPSYAAVNASNAQLWTWASSTGDYRALLKYASTTDRIASTYYNLPGFGIDINLTDGQSHQVALYLDDFDAGGRSETVTISDAASGTVLDTRTVSNFNATPQYLVWKITGHVVVQATRNTGANALVNGIFFDAASDGNGPPVSSTIFQKADGATLGNWKGVYGADGWIIPNDSVQPPAYSTVSFASGQLWTWASSTADNRALLKSASATDRIASTYYNSPGFAIDINLTDGQTHGVALYLDDYDAGGRMETITIVDAATNATLDSRSVANFGAAPQYLVWKIKGHVTVQVSRVAGANALVNGIFFQP